MQEQIPFDLDPARPEASPSPPPASVALSVAVEVAVETLRAPDGSQIVAVAQTVEIAVEVESGPAPKILALIDGANFMFRAYHAMKSMGREFFAPDGTPTIALSTFAKMVKSAKDAAQADAIAIVFESTTGTFRDALVDDYKADRPPTPDEVKIQMNLARALFPLMGIPVMWSDGFEADDVLCAYAADPGPGWRVAMCSSDKDLGQCIGAKAFQVIPDGWLIRDEAALRAKFGVGPELVAQFLALQGDSVDNIAGVDKVGHKTAGKLLNQYGTIAGIYENIDKLTPSVKKGFEDARDRIPILMQLTTADLNAPRPLTPDEIWMANRTPDWDAALDILRPLGMKALIARAETGSKAQAAKAARMAAPRP